MNKRCENLPPYSRKKPRSDEGMLFTEQRARSLSDRDRDCFLKLLANPPAPTKDLIKAAARRKGKPKLKK